MKVGDKVRITAIVEHVADCGSVGVKIAASGSVAHVVLDPGQWVTPDKATAAAPSEFRIGDIVAVSGRILKVAGPPKVGSAMLGYWHAIDRDGEADYFRPEEATLVFPAQIKII